MSDDGLDLFEREDELKDHARKLERERDEAREDAIQLAHNVIKYASPSLAGFGYTKAQEALGKLKPYLP